MVVDNDGTPLDGAEVFLRQGERVVRPKANTGYMYMFISRPGDYTLSVVREGGGSYSGPVTVEAQPASQSEADRQKMVIRLAE